MSGLLRFLPRLASALEAVRSVLGDRNILGDRTIRGTRLGAALDLTTLKLAARVEARDLITYLDVTGVVRGMGMVEPARPHRPDAIVVSIEARMRDGTRARRSRTDASAMAEVVPLRRSA